MSASVNLNNEGQEVYTGKDGIVIVNCFESIRGGRSLDATALPGDVISAGHVIIKETASGIYRPMPLSGSNYAALPGGHEYVGVLRASILKAKPFAGIMVRGTVNQAASPYPVASILSAFKTAVPHIIWTEDKI